MKNLNNLKTIGGSADFGYSQLTNLGNLQVIGGNIFFNDCQLTKEDFKNIKSKY